MVQARRHIGQRRRIRGVANQNDGLRPAAPIFRRGFVRERCGRSRASRFDFICRSLEGAAGARGALARRSDPVQRRSQGQLPFYSDAFFVREISYPKTSAHRASILKEGWLCPLST